jgi:lysophospholipase L1-like esterase
MQLGVPGTRGIYKGRLYRTNSKGLRGPDHTPLPEPGVFRIAIVGDSVTMASGAGEEDAYAAQLEKWLNTGSAEVRYEVINAGLGGINARQVMKRLEMVMREYRPDLIVYGFTLNDIEGEHYERRPRGVTGFTGEARRFSRSRSHLLRFIWPRLMSLLDLFSSNSYAAEIQRNFFENPAAWDSLEGEVERFAATGQAHGICAHVFIHTQLAQLSYLHPFKETYAKVEAAALEHGASAGQSLPRFDGLYAFDYWVTSYDPHPSRAGHTLLMQALIDGLRELPPACWQREGFEYRPEFPAQP